MKRYAVALFCLVAVPASADNFSKEKPVVSGVTFLVREASNYSRIGVLATLCGLRDEAWGERLRAWAVKTAEEGAGASAAAMSGGKESTGWFSLGWVLAVEDDAREEFHAYGRAACRSLRSVLGEADRNAGPSNRR